MKTLAKILHSNSGRILDAIDRYIAKADDGLGKQLKKEGFANPKKTVKAISSLEETIAGILAVQSGIFLAAAQDAAGIEEFRQAIDAILASDTISESVKAAVLEMYEDQVPKLAAAYMKNYESDLLVDTIRQRTQDHVEEWSEQLGELTRISTHEQLSKLIEDTITSGSSIQDLTRKILEGEWRNEYYQAKRLALTEVLRAHSISREEAIQQSPATDRKEWVHTGGHKIAPRPNHVAMNGQIVAKDQPFELLGADGVTYYPRIPVDPNLPAGEAINCHCTHRGIVNDDILGMTLEERQAMQQEIIENDDQEWLKELKQQSKAKAGIDI